jgi:allantoin racemase
MHTKTEGKKFWYQSYSTVGYEKKWSYYEEALRRHVPKVVRQNTEVHFHGIEINAPKKVESYYIRHLHISEIIKKALQAEEEGYDAFILGGMLDLGYHELREILNIPVVFICETSLLVACFLASKFAVISPQGLTLRGIEENIRSYGLEERSVPGVHLSAASSLDLAQSYTSNPRAVIDAVTEIAKKPIAGGADILIPGHGAFSLFLAEQGIREIDGVPVLDNTAVVLKMAELMVDFKNMGITRSRKGIYPEELIAVTKLYGCMK